MQEHLQHQLKNRHIQMIALGGAIGTGFFLGSSSAIQMTGPSITLAYLVGGLIIYAVMRALGEMSVDYPSSGSFVEYANRHMGPGVGFVAGWNAWMLFTCSCMLELTAIGALLEYWVHIPHWITSITLIIIVGGINLISVKYFGEAEFWFASIKVVIITAIILMGTYLLCFSHPVKINAMHNLKNYSHLNIFFNHGIIGFLNALVMACLSFCGAEFVTVAAGEAENPKKAIPKAINGVIVRIILFYVLTLTVIVLIYPFENISSNMNPFTDVFNKLGFASAASIINFVAITAAISALNSCLYVASRFIYNLSLNQHAPRILAKTGKARLPRHAILFTSVIVSVVAIANYVYPNKILNYLFSFITITIIINWYIILLTHMKFRKNKALANEALVYKMPWYPYLNILTMAALFIIVMVMSRTQDMGLSVYAAPGWIFVLAIIYMLKKGTAKAITKT